MNSNNDKTLSGFKASGQTSVLTTAVVAVLTFATPALADFVEIGRGSGVRRNLEIKSRRGDVVVVTEDFYVGQKNESSSTWTIDCPNRKMFATYRNGVQNVWAADGNLWYTASFPTARRTYNESIGEYYEYGCNGVIPENGEVISR